ncbi:MAG: ATP-dependent DNA helicase RecG [Candidatus Margulisiibacteriota bacterium]
MSEAPCLKLHDAVQYLKGVGPHGAQLLDKLGVRTLWELVTYFPREYEDRRTWPALSALKPDTVGYGLVRVVDVSHRQAGNRMGITKATVSDGKSTVRAVWFNQKYLKAQLKPGQDLWLKGRLNWNGHEDEWQWIISDTEWMSAANREVAVGCIVPVYALTAGLSQVRLRTWMRQAILMAVPQRVEPYPHTMLQEAHLMGLGQAIVDIHFPKQADAYHAARRRLVFDEFFYPQLAIGLRRYHVQTTMKSDPLMLSGELTRHYTARLPYTLTQAQQAVIRDVLADVQKTQAMNRLVQGDVGSGKTDVAAVALLAAVESGGKGAVMAPTEVLAHQHFLKFQTLLSPLGVKVVLVTGKQSVGQRQAALSELSKEDPLIVVGTHALIQEALVIRNLRLAVVDEQHRFGVLARTELRRKGANPHCLFMTATPIPRSLMLTAYGDLDKSIISEMPPGRVPPTTTSTVLDNENEIFRLCLDRLSEGRQVYIVFPLIEESEKIDLASAVAAFERLQASVFTGYKVGLLHGRMTTREKAEVLDRFKSNAAQVLVSTTVIEVGIDVPNATVMVIYHAERFGLAQLHQLRGRIGRGGGRSDCVLVCTSREDAKGARIKALVETTDGFKLAQIDLKLRGPGALNGLRQAGMPDYKLANLITDELLLLLAREMAGKVVASDPTLKQPTHKWIRSELARLNQRLGWGRLN